MNRKAAADCSGFFCKGFLSFSKRFLEDTIEIKLLCI